MNKKLVVAMSASIIVIVGVALLALFLLQDPPQASSSLPEDGSSTSVAESETSASDGSASIDPAEGGTVTAEITMEDGGVITLELYPGVAPKTVENFVTLAKDGFYDGLTFHRVVKGFMLQGGDPAGNGSGGPGHGIPGEFASNGWDNPLSHTRGVISMARSGDPDSARSQFFIIHGDSTFLDGDYAAFGRVVDGMDVVDQITEVEMSSTPNSLGEIAIPAEPVVIQSIRIIED